MRQNSNLLAIIIIIIFAITVEAQNIQYVNSTLWGGLNEVKVNGNYAYCSFINGLVVLDVSDSSNPTLVSQTYCNGRCYDLEIKGNYAYLVNRAYGIQIINVTDPANPVIAGTIAYSNYFADIQIDGNYIYTLDPDSVINIFDISNPTEPTLVSNLHFPFIVYNYCIDNGSLYLPHGFTMEITDISNPANPIPLGYFTATKHISEIKIQGEFAYLIEHAFEESNKFEVVNISYPQNPFAVGSLEPGGDVLYGLAIKGIFAYLVAGYLLQGWTIIDVIDISNPDSMTYLTAVPSEGSFGNICIAGNFAYIPDVPAKLSIFDISNPEVMPIVGFYSIPRQMYSVAWNNGYSYTLNFVRDLVIHDFTNPYNPIEIGRCDSSGWGLDIFAAESLCFVARARSSNSYWTGLQIIDVSNPAEPSLAGHCTTSATANGIYVEGNYGYLSLVGNTYSNYSALQAINISDPYNPMLAGLYETTGKIRDVIVDGNYAYFIHNYNGGVESLTVVNVFDPYSPILCSNSYVNRYSNFCINGNYAYIAEPDSGLTILDISSPAEPVEIAVLPDYYGCRKLLTEDGYLYIGGFGIFNASLAIYDISNPIQPFYVGGYEGPAYIIDFYVHEDYIYIVTDCSMIILRFYPGMGIGGEAYKPSVISLSQNYPNPFNPVTTIGYSIPDYSKVKLQIFDILGRDIATLIDKTQSAGNHNLIWDASGMPSGIYFYRITAGKLSLAKKMILIK